MRRKSIYVGQHSWDGFDAYLFDIDGTLLHCKDAVHYFAFCKALNTLSGRPLTLEGVTAHGNTDVGILRDALRLAEELEEVWRPQLPNALREMCSFVHCHASEFDITVLPCVLQTLDHLKSRGAVLGVATGNLEEIGRAKLKHAGLLELFEVGGWSDAFESRERVFRGAIVQMQTVARPGAKICFVGDTPSDINAAHANRLPVIAVSTGVYSRQQLLECGPDLCLGSLAELFDD